MEPSDQSRSGGRKQSTRLGQRDRTARHREAREAICVTEEYMSKLMDKRARHVALLLKVTDHHLYSSIDPIKHQPHLVSSGPCLSVLTQDEGMADRLLYELTLMESQAPSVTTSQPCQDLVSV